MDITQAVLTPFGGGTRRKPSNFRFLAYALVVGFECLATYVTLGRP